MTPNIISSVEDAANKAINKVKVLPGLIAEAGERLKALLTTDEVVPDEIQCIFSHREGSFYITGPNGDPLPFAYADVSDSTPRLTTHVLIAPFARRGSTTHEPNVRLKPQTANYLNSLLARPIVGLSFEVKMSGGGQVIGEDGEPTGESPGLGYIRYQAHTSV